MATREDGTFVSDRELRERACRFDKHCSCSHTDCRDGWLDEPDSPATRCPRCVEAVDMHFTLIEEERAAKRRRR